MPTLKIHRAESPDPRAGLSERAMDNLRFIRETMESAATFTAVSGWGILLVGLVAVVASVVAHFQRVPELWLAVWLADAAISMLIAAVAGRAKARRAGVPFPGPAGRKFLLGFVPPMLAGAVLTVVLWTHGAAIFLPGTWLLLYGAAVTAAGGSSVRLVPVMGLCFMLLGAATFALPVAWRDLAMAAGFGGLHLGFALPIARRHGG